MKNDEIEPLLSWTYYKDGTSDPPPKYDYDKLIAESTGLYSMWWILWRRIHPEWALYPEQPKEPEVKLPQTVIYLLN